MARTVLRNIRKDKAAGEELLRASDLDWTVVWLARLSGGQDLGAHRILRAGDRLGLGSRISRAALAAWLLREAEEPKHVREGVVVSGT